MNTSMPPQFLLPEDIDPRQFSRPEFLDDPVAVFPGVASYLDVPYAGPIGYRPLTLDLHVPTGVEGSLPVVVYAHPGGFFLGTRRMGPWRFLLDAGYAVASVGYRFSGEAVYPAAVHDVAAAIRWVRFNSDEYGLNGDSIVGMGSSAGGYLVSAIALADNDRAITGSVGPHAGTSSNVTAVIEHYAPTDFLQMDNDASDHVVELMDRPESTIARFLGYVPSMEPELARDAGLPGRVTSTSPPFLIVHGDSDHRVGIEQSRRLQRALRDAGARVEFMEVAGGDHGSTHFDLPPVHEASLDFLRTVVPVAHAPAPAPAATRTHR